MALTSYYAEQTSQNDLLSYFDRSALVVQQSIECFEKRYAQPGIRLVLKSFHDRPTRSTFLAVFLALSLLPALSFIGFSLSVFTSFIFVSLACAIASAAMVVALFGAILVATLMILLGVSVVLTGSGIGAYLAVRMIILVRDDGPRAGIAEWVQESKKHLFRPAADAEPATQNDTEDTKGAGFAETLIVGNAVVDGKGSLSESQPVPQEDAEPIKVPKEESE